MVTRAEKIHELLQYMYEYAGIAYRMKESASSYPNPPVPLSYEAIQLIMSGLTRSLQDIDENCYCNDARTCAWCI